jgi:ribosomal protein L7/L12
MAKYGWRWSPGGGWSRITAVPPGPYSVFLHDPGAAKIAAAAALALHSDLGIKESRDLIDSAPGVVLAQVSEEAARLACAALTGAGATAAITRPE